MASGSWKKGVKSDEDKKRDKAEYERQRYQMNKKRILKQQSGYYYGTNKKRGIERLSRTEIMERHRLREEQRRRDMGIGPRQPKQSHETLLAKKRKYMNERNKRLRS